MSDHEGQAFGLHEAPDPGLIYEPPSGWVWTTVGQLGEVKGGKRLPQGHQYAEVRTGFPYIRVTDFSDGTIALENLKYLEPRTRQDILNYTVAAHDVYISIAGTIGVTGVVPQALDGGNLTENAAKVTNLSGGLPKYLHLWLASPVGQILIAQKTVATTQAKLALFRLQAVTVPLAPIAEQHRIVAEIEKQFSRLDAGVAALKRVQAALKRYRAAVLQTACTGRLVPTEAELARAEERDYEPADQLLARILGERRERWEMDQLAQMQARGKPTKGDGWRRAYPSPAAVDESGLLEPPTGWVWTTVDTMLAEGLSNGISVKGSDIPPGVPALRLNAMGEHGFDYSVIRYLPIDDALAEDLRVVAGDFFVSRGNGSLALVGRGTLAQAPPFRVVFPDTMIRLRFTSIPRLTRWVPAIWSAPWLRRQIEQRVKTTAGIWKISQPQVASVPIPLPPLNEQIRIVAEVERRLSIIEETEAVVEANLKRAERLRQAILKRAFEGKLVPQEPDDEPASVLLERIRAERAAVAANGAERPVRRATASTAGARKGGSQTEANRTARQRVLDL